MSNRSNSPSTIGTAVRLPPIPFKRVFRDANKYSRKDKHKGRSHE